jgi:transposase
LAGDHPEWVIGFEDETWWSRLAQPAMHAWTEVGRPLHLVQQTVAKSDPDPKALSCYGVVLDGSFTPSEGGRVKDGANIDRKQVWLRFVKDRPISEATSQFLEWVCNRLAGLGKKALFLTWDNAPWHTSRWLRQWIKEHNRQVKRTGQGVRIVCCYLPIKSPWLNPIEPRWVHAKRQVAEPGGLLTAEELTRRVYHHFECQPEEHIAILEKVA